MEKDLRKVNTLVALRKCVQQTIVILQKKRTLMF